MFKFISGKPLWVHILLAIILVFLLLFLFLWSLGFVTRHGKTLTIPSVTGVSLAEAEKLLDEKGFEVEIQDSIFVDTASPLSVLRQFPEADAVVKKKSNSLSYNQSGSRTYDRYAEPRGDEL